ncbi:MAG: LysM peptidoglycan-binding domain-containing protein [Candidatus Scalindua sp.]|nr:LysM peptidoglycan-binding domain-containing protein [Candidatus Scalindua sp.]
MRLSEQTGLLLGIVILVLIGVFVSTRTSLNENKMVKFAVSKKNFLKIEDLPVKPRQTKEGRLVTSFTSEKKIIHKISSNENLSKISTRYYGDAAKWGKIYDANKNIITDPNSLKVGQEILIPDIST